ncbi:MAG: hypothetical protein ACREK8_08725 [Gemmatimonadales bacterium]
MRAASTSPISSTAPALGDLLRAAGITVRELLAACESGDPSRSRLEVLDAAMQRAAVLSGQLDGRSRHHRRTTSLDLNTVVQQLAPSLQRLLGPFVSLETELESRGLWAAVDRSQLEQVALGLVINAREALPLGGHVRIATRYLALTHPATHRVGELAPGEWAVLEVTDGGAGIDERLVPHLIETAQYGLPVDSSLSLATVSGIVRDAGGQMILDIAPDGRTILGACFPAVDRPRGRRPAMAVADAVLVVADDEWSRLSAARTLRRAGYGVLEAEHAEAAFELLDDVAGSCVCLVLVPAALAASGLPSFAEQLRRDRPDLEVLPLPVAPDELLSAVGQRLPRAR